MQKFSGKDYIKIAIANTYGLDKEPWDKRIDWVNKNQENLEDFIKEADSPEEYYAAVLAFRQMQNDEPIGYAVGLDATASGIQWLSVLTHDKKAAMLCNVLNSGKREDIYTNLYHQMCEKTGTSEKIKRDDIKQAIMTSAYGSQAKPKEIFGEGTSLFYAFIQLMNQELPEVWGFNKFALDIWRKDIDHYGWIMPDNFHCQMKVKVPVAERFNFNGAPYEVITYQQGCKDKGRELSANIAHSLDGYANRELCRRCNYDKAKVKKVLDYLNKPVPGYSSGNLSVFKDLWFSTKMISLRIIDILEEDHRYVWALPEEMRNQLKKLLESLEWEPFEVYSVHDCFYSHPNYCNIVREVYKTLLAEVCKGNLLHHILVSYLGKEIELDLDPEFSEEIIKESEYALS